MKWINFFFLRDSASGLTSIWEIRTREGDTILGEVSWWSRWRKYVFAPRYNVILEEDCLRDIASFCEGRTKAHRDKTSREMGR